MIPRRLRLHNFLSYRECTIDLAGLRLAVLCGRNGEGKSALLDGMTWALWGKGRGDLEDDRIHLAEQEMLVEFEFDVGAERYLALRKRTRGKGSSLDFFQLDAAGARTSLSGGVIRDTQDEITRRVRMDYDTFANSAFVAQGRANQFTQLGPKDRKEVFRKILGLDRFEQLSQRANELRKETALLLKELERSTQADAAEVEEIPAVDGELARIAGERELLRPRVAQMDEVVLQLRQAARDFEQLRQEEQRAERAVRDLESAVAMRESEVVRLTTADEAARRQVAAGETVRERYARLGALRAAVEQHAALQTEARRLEAVRDRADGLVREEQVRLAGQEQSLAQEVRALAQLAEGLSELERRQATLEQAAAGVEEQAAEADRARAEESAARERAAAARAEMKSCKAQNADLQGKRGQLEGVAQCPVCRGALTPGDVEHVRGEYTALIKELGEQYRGAEVEALAAEQAADGFAREGERLRIDVARGREAVTRDQKELHAALVAARQAAAILPEREAALAELRQVVAAGGFALEARSRSEEATAALAALAYSAVEHEAARGEARALAGAEAEYQGLLVAEQQAIALAEQLEREQEALAEKRRALEDAGAAFADARRAAAETEDVRPRLAAAEEALAGARAMDAELTRQQGAAEQKLEYLRGLQARVAAAVTAMAAKKDEELTYGELTRAFGRDGVQAMLIDQSLPEVEQTANHMLDRMTNGRIHVALSTRREKQGGKGGTVETLDINISDEVGTRDYAMYSGGEAFRVDFALRIALARLLAARSGAELPTLIIDEGFGTQDHEGIDRLVEAINGIREEFRLILVVTHVDELRERFERRIEVTKDPVRGSSAKVV